MDIKKQTTHRAGACNFCNSGTLSRAGNSLIYPYTYVYNLSGSGLGANICPDCAKQLMAEVFSEEL